MTGQLTPKQSLIAGFSESLLAILELTIGLAIVRSALDQSQILEMILPNASFGTREALTQFIMTSTVCYWMAFRAASSFNLNSAKKFWERIGGKNVKLSPLGISVILMHAFGLFSVWYMSNKFEKPILSLENYYFDAEYTTLNWRRITEMLIFAPLREELVFRGIMVNIFYRKVCLSGDPILTLLAQTFGPSVMFSLIHLFNFSAGKFSNSYVVVQVLIGFLVGSFYSMRYISSNTIWEPLLLHMGNNFFSSFLSSRYAFDSLEPMVVFPSKI
jgi:membrane protease YdiL (CAAX protease family)